MSEAVPKEQEESHADNSGEGPRVPRTPDEADEVLPNEGMGALPVLAKICAGDYDEEPHWVDIEPTTDAQEFYNRQKQKESDRVAETGQILGNWIDEDGIVGEYLREKAETTPEINKQKVKDTHGTVYPIVGGFHLKNIEEDDERIRVHKKYRTSKYDVFYRVKQLTREEAINRYGITEAEMQELEAEGLDPDREFSIGQVFVSEGEGYGN